VIRCVIFDLWGTLIDNNPQFNGKEIIPKMFGLERRVFTSFLRHEWGLHKEWTDRDFFARWLNFVGKNDAETLEELLKIWKKHYENVFVYEDVKPVLKELKTKGIKIGLLSNTEQVTKVLEREGLTPLLDFLAMSYDIKVLKPDHDAFKTAMQIGKCRPEETVMVGDKLEMDIWPAKQLGIKSVLIDRKGKFAVAYPADAKISSMSELPAVITKLNKS